MKRINRKGGFTLIEVLLAIVIFAAIALPLMSVFLQSVKTDKAARNVLNANYIAQDYIEKLDTLTYRTLLDTLPNKIDTGGYYLSAKAEPYGNAQSLFADASSKAKPCAFLHVVMLSDGKVLVVLPDGKQVPYTALPPTISVSVSNGTYTFSAGGTTKTGTAAYGRYAVILNAMNKVSGKTTTLTLGANTKAVAYCTSGNKGEVTVPTGTPVYVDVMQAKRSMVHVTVSVYEKSTDSEPVAVSETYVNVRNEAS